jgi:hypothetical protein
MARHEVYMHVGLLEAFPKSGVQRTRIMDFIRSLHEHPDTRGDFTDRDASLRERQIKIVGTTPSRSGSMRRSKSSWLSMSVVLTDRRPRPATDRSAGDCGGTSTIFGNQVFPLRPRRPHRSGFLHSSAFR